MNADRFELELRRTLASLADVDAPTSLQALVASLPVRQVGIGGRLRDLHFRPLRILVRIGSIGVAGTAVLVMLALLGSAAFNRVEPRPIEPAGVPPAVTFSSGLASLEASDLIIEVNGRTFRPTAETSTHSDPGNANYRTLELGWDADGTEMRLNMYFAADARIWWVSQLRTYDGRSPGDWIYYLGPLFQTPLGQSFEGDADLVGVGIGGVGHLRIAGMRLTAFAPGTVPKPTPQCQPAGPVGGGPVPNFTEDDLAGFGIRLGMPAAAAGAELRQRGICSEYRLNFEALNQGQHWCVPPPGKLDDVFLGIRGELILVVVDRAPRMPDPELPFYVGC